MKLVWSNLAIEELQALRTHSIGQWGRDVALRYMADIHDVATRVAARPDRARHLKGPFRLARVRSHYLIVHVDEATDRLTIARIVHTAMDLERHLPPN